MNAVLKEKCLKDIKATLSSPRPTINQKSLSIVYLKNDLPKYCVLSRLEAAALLEETGSISYYTVGSEINLYTKKLLTITGSNYAPVQTEVAVHQRWEDLQLSQRELINICALHELYSIGKVIRMDNLKIAS